MAKNTVETAWVLTLDESKAREGENAIERLADAVQDKLGRDSTAAINKTTEAIHKQTEALKETEAQAGRTGNAVQSGGKSDGKSGATDFAGDVASSSAGLRGAADFFSGGNSGAIGGVLQLTEALGDLGEFAPQAAAQLVTLASSLGLVAPAAQAAGAAGAAASTGLLATATGLAAMLAPLLPLAIAIGAVVAVLAVLKQAEDQRAADLKKQVELERAISDEIAAGATSEDIREQIALLNERSELEQGTLERGKKAYDEYIESVRNSFGGLGKLLEPFVKLFGSYEEQLASNVTDSEKLIKANAEKEDGYQAALERGDAAKNDAKKREEELADSREKTAKEAEKTAKEKETADKKSASEAEQQAEQRAAKEKQIEEKRYNAAQKYGDALVDIARRSADDAQKIAKAAREKESDNSRAFQQDISDLSTDFHIAEREEAIKRREEEAATLKQHADMITGIRDKALDDEVGLLRKRDFLGAANVRENANKQIEQENKTFLAAQEEKMRLQKSEDAAQLRELDDARQKRLTDLKRANAEAQIQYRRDIENQRESRRIAEREAKIARDRELRAASEMARALLGIQVQQNQAQLQLAQNTLSQLRGITNTTNNKTVNGGINFNLTQSGGGLSMGAVQQQILSTLGTVGLA